MVGGGAGEEISKGKRKRNSTFLKEAAADEPKRSRVHAQRKFAQGAGGASPLASPLKDIRTRAKVDNGSSSSSSSSGPSFPAQKGERPKTEDFLTFLCLRGTDYLPPELDFFNQASTTQNNETSDDSFSDQDDLNKDPEVDKNGVEKKSSKRMSKEAKIKKVSNTNNLKKKDPDSKQKEDKNGSLRKTRSHSQDSLSSPERKTEPRHTRSQVETKKHNNVKEDGAIQCKEDEPKVSHESRTKNKLHPTNNRESESSDESLSDRGEKSVRKNEDLKSDSELDADEEASSRESSRRPNPRRSTELKLKDSLSILKQREARSTSRDSSGSKESLQAIRPSRKTKEAAKSYLNLLGQKLAPKKSEVSSNELNEPKDENLDNASGTDNEIKVSDSVSASIEKEKEEEVKNVKEKRDSKKEKKHKKKKCTSLKDLQNSLLAEAKRNVSDPSKPESSVVTSGVSTKRPSTSPGDSDTPDTDERITISQKTGYINVKSRKSIDQVSEDGSVDSRSPQRRNSGAFAGPSGKKLAKAGERVPTPPRKILPKAESDPQRASVSPVSNNRTNHLPVGVMGAAGLSSRYAAAQPVAMTKAMVSSHPSQQQTINTNPAVVASSTYSQPLVIQTSMQTQKQLQQQPNMSSIPMSAPTAQPTILVPGPNPGQQGGLRLPNVPIQMSAMPLQMQSVRQPAGIQQVQMVGARPQVVSTGYQGMAGIPILGPAGMQFGIPVQTAGLQGLPPQMQNSAVQVRSTQVPGHQAVVTVPTFIRSGFTYSQPIVTGNISSVPVTHVDRSSVEEQQQPSQKVNVSNPSELPQTITMPSGTTIQYNVPPTSIKQPTLLQQQQSKESSLIMQTPTKPPTVPTSSYVISTNASPLLSPGPPTLSPQIAGSSRSAATPTTSNRQMRKPDGPPILTPPVRKHEESKARRELHMKPQRQQSPVAITSTNEMPQVPLYSPQAVYSSQSQSAVQNFCQQPDQVSASAYHNQGSGVYPHSPVFNQQSSPGSFHSPASVHSPVYHQMVSPHTTPLRSPQANHYQQSSYTHGYPVSPVQYPQYQTSQQHHQPSPPEPVSQPLHSPLHLQHQQQNQISPPHLQPIHPSQQLISLPTQSMPQPFNSPLHYQEQHQPSQTQHMSQQFNNPTHKQQHEVSSSPTIPHLSPLQQHHPQTNQLSPTKQLLQPTDVQKHTSPPRQINQPIHQQQNQITPPQHRPPPINQLPTSQPHQNTQPSPINHPTNQKQDPPLPPKQKSQPINQQLLSTSQPTFQKQDDAFPTQPASGSSTGQVKLIPSPKQQPVNQKEQVSQLQRATQPPEQQQSCPVSIHSSSSEIGQQSGASSPQSQQPLHSPLTHSSAHNYKKMQKQKTDEDTQDVSETVEGTKEESLTSTKSEDNPQQKPEKPQASSSKKKNPDKMLKTKLGDKSVRAIKSFDVEDDSSPYAFDFDKSETVPKMSFRKSSSPLKPPMMMKKLNKPSDNLEAKKHDDLKPSSSKSVTKQETAPVKPPKVPEKLENPKDSVLVECDAEKSVNESKVAENPEDTSSSDNETTYFIPLKNSSGQSFGVAVKLGTDGPCGPNQKVIMTAKLVTSPSNRPTKAKILGGKTTESKTAIPLTSPRSPVQSTSTPSKETPKKLRMPNASPVAPNRRNLMSPIMDCGQQHHPAVARPRVRRAMSPDSGLSTGSNVKDNSSNSGKKRPMCLLGQVNTGHRFPRLGQHAQMMEAPTFRPSEEEFKDPLRYIQKIRSYAEQFGMCRIIPPKNFKPECNVDDDMRFTAYNQYINRMLSRWGPNAKETAAIKKYLETQNVDTRAHPLVGGLEVDLPALYHAVQSFGGLTEVIQKKKWNKIAEYLRVSRGSNATAAGNKLDDIYVKWLLPYDTLSSVEREELLRLVEEEWAEQSRDKADKFKQKDDGEEVEDEEEEEEDDEDQEAVVKGKSTSLTAFYRLAKNLMSMVFRNDEEPPHHTVEDEYWKIVTDKDVHMQVSQGSIDTGAEGFGFPIRNSSFSTHPWNLKVLTKNPRSILRAMGSVMGVTQPTLHVGMLFTTGCWYRDPHGLPWIEYLHTGAPKIWYGIPDDHSLAFYTAMKQLVPSFCKNRKIWLPSDTTMVSPSTLVKHGVSISRAVQQPGQFVVVFPKSYTSSICTGYCVSESVYYASGDWLQDMDSTFQDIKDSMEPMMFPPEKMLFALASDQKSTRTVLEVIKPKIEKIRDREIRERKEVNKLGVKITEKLNLEKASGSKDQEDDEYECQVCNANLYVSLIANEEEESTYCLSHGLEYVRSNTSEAKQCKLMYTHTLEELREILKKIQHRLEEGAFMDEPEEDTPVKDDDIVDIEDEDYVDEEDIKPRDRSLPSYIKKEKKPLISSESEDDEDEKEEEDEDNVPVIGADDYLDDFAEEDIPAIEALFSEDDEIVRPSSKRRAPRVRKFSETSDEEGDDEEDGETEIAVNEQKIIEKKVNKNKVISPKKVVEPKKVTRETLKKSVKGSKEVKTRRKTSESELPPTTSKNTLKTEESEKSVELERGKRKTKEEVETDIDEISRKKFKAKDVSVKVKKISTKGELEKGKLLRNKEKEPETSKETIVTKDAKKTTPAKREKEEKAAPAKTKKKAAAKVDKGKQRRSKKRKAKCMDAADQFNLLDIILTETDDENYCSNSEKESVETSSDEEYWK